MKVNFKRMITALAAAAMCAVPMTSAMSASASFEEAYKGQRVQMEMAKVNTKNIIEFQGDSATIKALQNDKEYMNIMENTSFDTIAEKEGEWCGNGLKYKFRKEHRRVIIIIIVIGPIIVWPPTPEDPPRDYMVSGLKEEKAALEMADKRASLKMAEMKPAFAEKAGAMKFSKA